MFIEVIWMLNWPEYSSAFENVSNIINQAKGLMKEKDMKML